MLFRSQALDINMINTLDEQQEFPDLTVEENFLELSLVFRHFVRAYTPQCPSRIIEDQGQILKAESQKLLHPK